MTLGNMKNDLSEMEHYRKSCETEFWQNVFRAESEYLLRHLKGCQTVLSVGCGPAVVEGLLSQRGLNVTGLDVTTEALGCAPDGVRTVVGRAEEMPFEAATFDAVIFVASLQFIEDWRQAVAEAARVLRDGGRLIVLLLNPASAFFREKFGNPHSYVRKIRQRDLSEIETAIAGRFNAQTEYFLGVNGTTLFESREPASAALFVIHGARKETSP
jgi:SAM-dependent methyltransferase